MSTSVLIIIVHLLGPFRIYFYKILKNALFDSPVVCAIANQVGKIYKMSKICTFLNYSN